MENNLNSEVSRKDLKIQALLEKVSAMTAQYENQVADLRVELTLAEQEKNYLKERLFESSRDAEESQEPSEDA